MLSIRGLAVGIGTDVVIEAVDLDVDSGELHALMGPNGSGKSTLSLALAGHPHYAVNDRASVKLDGQELVTLPPEARARSGLFLGFQHPVAIPGLSVEQLIKTMVDHLRPEAPASVATLRQTITGYCALLGIDPEFLKRSVNDGFSGGESKRLEMLQLLMAEPKYAVLDEIDSGLDVDAIKLIADAVNLAQEKFGTGFLVITHYRRILDYMKPDRVHVLVKGKVVKSGGPELIESIESGGYKQLTDLKRKKL